VATVVRHDLAGCEGFRLESPDGLLGWVEETWLGTEGGPVALAIRTVDGRDGLLLAEDVATMAPDSELLTMGAGTRLLELELPRVVETASSDGLAASWHTTGRPLEPPPEPPGALDRALLAIRPWRLAPPPLPAAERPLWQQVAILYCALTLIVVTVISAAFIVAWIATGSAY
jgi:hypothetical protein